MGRDLKSSFIALVLLTLLTGVFYPLAITLVAQLAFPRRANGSLVTVDGVVRGSDLIGQQWSGPQWFHGRASANGCDARSSGGTNLGPTNPALAAAFAERATTLRADGVAGPLPVDLLTASASGLDPHVTPAGARAQVERVAHARGLAPERVRALVDAHVESRFLGVFGEARVNVLVLNLALDAQRERGAGVR